jgi:hypothetical protein
MNSVRRVLTGMLNNRSVSTPTAAGSVAVTVSPYPYGTSGRLSAVPWEGLQLDVND